MARSHFPQNYWRNTCIKLIYTLKGPVKIFHDLNPYWAILFAYFNIMSQYFILFTNFIYWIHSAPPDRTVCPLVGRWVDWSVHPSVHLKQESIKINTIKSRGCIFSQFFRCITSSLCTLVHCKQNPLSTIYSPISIYLAF